MFKTITPSPSRYLRGPLPSAASADKIHNMESYSHGVLLISGCIGPPTSIKPRDNPSNIAGIVRMLQLISPTSCSSTSTPLQTWRPYSSTTRYTTAQSTNSPIHLCRISSDFKFIINDDRYKQRLRTDYKVPQVTLKQIHEAIPKHLYQKSTLKGLSYVARDAAFASLFFVRLLAR